MSFSSSSSMGGGGGTSKSVSQKTVVVNGVQKTIKKTTIVNPDGTKNITEETSDGVNVERKKYMIGTDNQMY